MSKPERLDLIFANIGSITDPGDSDAAAGFSAGETFPYQEWNFLIEQTSWLLSNVNSYGTVEWDIATPYAQGARVTYNGIRYKCTVSNTGVIPTSPTNWEIDDGKVIGSIIPFDGSSWVDGVTKPGWYACTAANAVHGAPDLTDRFIKAHSGVLTLDGSDTYTLTESQLNAHSHAVTSLVVSGGSHEHEYSRLVGSTSGDAFESTSVVVEVPLTGSSLILNSKHQGTLSTTYTFALETSDSEGGGHTHSLVAQTNAFGTGSSFTYLPEHYTSIMIRKCY